MIVSRCTEGACRNIRLILRGVWSPPSFALHLVLVVTDVFAISIPSVPTDSISFLRRVQQRFLALVVAAVRLDKIYYVELVSHIFLCVEDLEIIPLSVGSCPMVVFQN